MDILTFTVISQLQTSALQVLTNATLTKLGSIIVNAPV